MGSRTIDNLTNKTSEFQLKTEPSLDYKKQNPSPPGIIAGDYKAIVNTDITCGYKIHKNVRYVRVDNGAKD